MDSYLGSTPFGRRGMTLGMLANQYKADQIETGLVRDKWKLFRAVCEARPHLGITDRALTVLDALLTFYPETDLSEKRGLVVFPSNTQLSLRSRGMTPATLRRHLAALIEAGLIIRKDSPNGKRYARRDRAGDISQAFGFSLAPLLARALEIESLARQIQSDREQLRLCKEELTLYRRDISKLIGAAIESDLEGEIGFLQARFRILITRIPRIATAMQLEPILGEMRTLRDDILNSLKPYIKTEKVSASESHIERHIQDSQPDFITESENASDKTVEENCETDRSPHTTKSEPLDRIAYTSSDNRPFPLSMIMRACNEIASYGPDAKIRNWRDFQTAAIVVRTMLGISDAAYRHANNVLGPENTATVMACILERAGHINSPGGYLRNLTLRAERREFSPGPMLMTLLRIAGKKERNLPMHQSQAYRL